MTFCLIFSLLDLYGAHPRPLEAPLDPSSTSKCPKVNGGHDEIPFDSRNFKAVYRDGYTNEKLPDDLVRAAICEELTYFNDRVWQITDIKTAEN